MTFVEKAIDKYGDLYDYTPTIYVHSKTKVKIGCKKCGDIFEQRPNDHLNGSGCPACKRKDASDSRIGSGWKERCILAHPNNEYDYSESDYINADTKFKIKCLKHGDFYQTPRYHYSGGRCPDCIKNKPDTRLDTKTSSNVIDMFGEKHGSLYDYSAFEYHGMDEGGLIRCREHGTFIMSPIVHMRHGCPLCVEESIGSVKNSFVDYICNISTDMVSINYKIGDVFVDCYVDSHKIAFCFNGLRSNAECIKGKTFNIARTIAVESEGVHLVVIYEDDWMYKESIIKSRINNILNPPKHKIYARECDVRDVEFNECKEFLNSNHIQGNCVSKYRYGLYHDNSLVSVMTFGHTRKNLSSVGVGYELLRFCNKLDYSITGSASRLFSMFVKSVNPEVIISYADRSWSSATTPTVYDKIGFEFIKTTDPNYYYFNNSEYKRHNRYNFRKDVLVSDGYDSTKTEIEIMTDRGYDRIWDSGSIKYTWTNNRVGDYA